MLSACRLNFCKRGLTAFERTDAVTTSPFRAARGILLVDEVVDGTVVVDLLVLGG